jgi:small conductance mechanosensitive channel
MPYDESFPKVKKIIVDSLLNVPKVLKDPLPEVGIQNFDSHNVQLLVRPYVEPCDYWEVTFELHKAIKAAFHYHDIRVAYSEGVEMGRIGE